ncbi:MAG: hypothetical protein GXY44_10510 [Phycisphaerales bacterium]|nr:hypothetical protein [Phycisphaerales bacterium]
MKTHLSALYLLMGCWTLALIGCQTAQPTALTGRVGEDSMSRITTLYERIMYHPPQRFRKPVLERQDRKLSLLQEECDRLLADMHAWELKATRPDAFAQFETSIQQLRTVSGAADETCLRAAYEQALADWRRLQE